MQIPLVELIKINGNFVALLNITLTYIYIYKIHTNFIVYTSCVFNFNFHFLEDHFKRDEEYIEYFYSWYTDNDNDLRDSSFS